MRNHVGRFDSQTVVGLQVEMGQALGAGALVMVDVAVADLRLHGLAYSLAESYVVLGAGLAAELVFVVAQTVVDLELGKALLGGLLLSSAIQCPGSSAAGILCTRNGWRLWPGTCSFQAWAVLERIFAF